MFCRRAGASLLLLLSIAHGWRMTPSPPRGKPLSASRRAVLQKGLTAPVAASPRSPPANNNKSVPSPAVEWQRRQVVQLSTRLTQALDKYTNDRLSSSSKNQQQAAISAATYQQEGQHRQDRLWKASSTTASSTRRNAIGAAFGFAWAVLMGTHSASNMPKLYNLPNDQLAAILLHDIIEKQSLVTADLTRSIYDERATFKDGSDLDGRYSMGPWIAGCRLLFNAKHCHSRLIDNSLKVSDHEVTFRFEEDLQFRGPFSPRCFLSGKVVMKRDLLTGLILSYEEFWDQDVATIIQKAKLKY